MFKHNFKFKIYFKLNKSQSDHVSIGQWVFVATLPDPLIKNNFKIIVGLEKLKINT